jgi:hypothetical protein
MEIVNLVINVVAYIILGSLIWLLRNQIKLQKDTLDSQSKTIQNMKMFVDIFQPEKIHEYVKMREVTFEDTKNKEIEKIKSEMEEKLKKRSDTIKLVFEEMDSLLQIALNLAYYVDRQSRKEALERSPNSLAKSSLIKTVETFPYHGDMLKIAMLEAFVEKSLGKHSGEG